MLQNTTREGIKNDAQGEINVQKLIGPSRIGKNIHKSICMYLYNALLFHSFSFTFLCKLYDNFMLFQNCMLRSTPTRTLQYYHHQSQSQHTHMTVSQVVLSKVDTDDIVLQTTAKHKESALPTPKWHCIN